MKKTIRITSLILIVILASIFWIRASAKPEAPVQPVAFDHWQHVTKEDGPGLDCAFCHDNAAKSAHATVPNTSVCMACHESMKTESPEVQKLAAYSEAHQQPPWARVYFLSDTADAYFTHKPHIRAKVDCAACHGQVAQSHQIRREVKHTMGWCVDCHRQQNVSTDCYVCHR
jgi:hypothetical protein